MRTNKLIRFSVLMLVSGLALGSCIPLRKVEANDTQAGASVVLQENAQEVDNVIEVQATVEEKSTEETVEPTPVEIQTPELTLPDQLAVITAENAQEIEELASISPYFPHYYLVSPDGRVGAIGDLDGIDIIDMASGELISQFPVELPNSKFGIDRYFQFSQDGSLIALTTKNEIQVWQVGGGMLYAAPYNREISTDMNIFGAEIPQLALSPDGTLLAVSGVDFISGSAKQYFKVINIQENRTVYTWNGKDESPHGALYTYDGLGFSADGKMLQTFDATRFYAASGTAYESFRFWWVDSWQEMNRISEEVSSGFDKRDLLFALQIDESVDFINRTNGQTTYRLTDTGCSQAYPCDIKLSSDGNYAAILDYTVAPVQYHRDLLATKIDVWDLAGLTKVDSASLTVRNLDGLYLQTGGDFQAVLDQNDEMPDENTWWTSETNFLGISAEDGQIHFVPQRISTIGEDNCYFCGTCTLDLEDGQTDCEKGFYSTEKNYFEFYYEGLNAILSFTEEDSSKDIQVIELPEYLGDNWSVRMLGYSETYLTAFYCLDKAMRQQTCQIYDLESENIVNEREDIYSVQFSPEGEYAAFIDREEKALFLVNMALGKISKVEAYQSRAWPINPSFGKEGTELVYMVQNLTSTDVLSLEWVEAEGSNVLRRSNLDTTQIVEPTLMDWGVENELIALANDYGYVYLLGQERGKLIHFWQADREKIIGLSFAKDNKVILTMNQDGLIRIWGVKK